MSASAPAFRPVVKADGPQPPSAGPVLLLDVLAQDRDGGHPAGPAKYDPGHSLSCRGRREDTPLSELTRREMAAVGGKFTSR